MKILKINIKKIVFFGVILNYSINTMEKYIHIIDMPEKDLNNEIIRIQSHFFENKNNIDKTIEKLDNLYNIFYTPEEKVLIQKTIQLDLLEWIKLKKKIDNEDNN